MNDHRFKAGENARENGKKGGIESGKARARKKTMRETAEILLALPLMQGKCADIESFKNLQAADGKNITTQSAIILQQIRNALQGDKAAAEFIRDLIGERPQNQKPDPERILSDAAAIDPLTLSLMEEAERMERETERGSHEKSNAPDFEISCTRDS